jgi:hypothetical protein
MCVSEHLRLSKEALEREHALDIFGISEVTRQLKPGVCVLLGKADCQLLNVVESRRAWWDGAVDQALTACVIASINWA